MKPASSIALTDQDRGEWLSIVLDLREQYTHTGERFSNIPIALEMVYQLSSEQPGTYAVGLRNALMTTKLDRPTVREQPGDNVLVFDFESETVDFDDWVRSDGADVYPQSENYRGRFSLETQLNRDASSGSVSVHTAIENPRGVWVAQVYVPEGTTNVISRFASFLQGETGYAHSTRGEAGWKRLQGDEWTTIIWDNRDAAWETERALLAIEFDVAGGSFTGPVRVDDVYIIRDPDEK